MNPTLSDLIFAAVASGLITLIFILIVPEF
jgi:hypothetical protein